MLSARIAAAPIIRWKLAVRKILILGTEYKPAAPHGMDQRYFPRHIDLAAQATEMNIHEIGAGVEPIAPNLLEQHGPGDDLSRMAEQIFEQFDLAWHEIDDPRAPPGDPRQQVELEVLDT
jgi:hypothetical protein